MVFFRAMLKINRRILSLWVWLIILALSIPAQAAEMAAQSGSNPPKPLTQALRPFLYIVQDMHESLAAQEQIAQKIKELNEGQNVELIGMEGADGLIDAEALKYSAPQDRVSEAAHYFVSQGELGGAEYAYLSNENGMTLFGVEDPAVYSEDLALYQKMLENRTSAVMLFNQLDGLLDRFELARYRKEERTLRSLWKDFSQSRFSLISWYEQVDPILRWRRVPVPAGSAYGRLREMMEISAVLNEKVFNKELTALEQEFLKKAGRRGKAVIEALSQARDSSPEWQEHFLNLLAAAEVQRINLDTYPNIMRKARLLNSIYQLNSKNLFDEIDNLHWELRASLAGNDDEKEWVHLKQRIHLARRMCLGELTPVEWVKLNAWNRQSSLEKEMLAWLARNVPKSEKQVKQVFEKLDPILKNAEAFYSLAEYRSYLMAHRLLQYMKENSLQNAVLVAGGFHTPYIQRYLNRLGVNYESWTPKISGSDRKIPYEELILNLNLSSMATIRFQSGLKPVSGSKLNFQRAFLSRMGRDPKSLEIEELIPEQELIPAGGASLGARPENTFDVKASDFTQVFDALIAGKSPWHEKYQRVLFENKGFFQEWPVDEAFRQYKPELVLSKIFTNKNLMQMVLSSYLSVLKRSDYDPDKKVIYSDLLFFAMERAAETLSDFDRADFLAKKEMVLKAYSGPEANPVYVEDTPAILAGYGAEGSRHFYAGKAAWMRFWDGTRRPLIGSLFTDSLAKQNGDFFKVGSYTVSVPYKRGDNVKQLVEKAKQDQAGKGVFQFDYNKAEEEEDLTKGGEFDLEAQKPESAKRSGEIILSFETADGKSIPEKKDLEPVLAEMDRLAQEIADVQVNLGAVMEHFAANQPEVNLEERIGGWQKGRGVSRFVTALGQIFEGHSRKPEAPISEFALNPEKKFLASRAAGIFYVDDAGNVVNWDEAVVAYINASVRKRKELSGLDESVRFLPYPEQIQDEAERERYRKTLWELYFPSLGNWELTFSVYPKEEELTGSPALDFNAFWLTRVGTGRNVKDSDIRNYVVLGPKSHTSLNPFLKLQNPTDQYFFYRIEKNKDGTQKAVRLENTAEITAMAGLLLVRQVTVGNEAPQLFNPETGMKEVNLEDPVRKIISLFRQIAKGGTLIREDAMTRVEKITPADEEEQQLFQPVFARQIRFNDPSEQAKWSRDKVSLDAALGLYGSLGEPSVPQPGDAVKDLSDNLDFWSGRAQEAVRERPNLHAETEARLIPEKGAVSVKLVSGSGVVLYPNSIKFIIEGQERGMSFDVNEVTGFRGQGALIIAAAVTFLEAQSETSELRNNPAYQFWRPFLIDAYRRVRNSADTAAEGRSLGGLLEKRFEIEKGLVETGDEGMPSLSQSEDFLFANRLAGVQGAVRDIETAQQGPYELIVFWDALKKGILFQDLERLLSRFKNLRITIVDDSLSSDEIFRDLKRRDPQGLLTRYLADRKVVIPKNPKLEYQLAQAKERLSPLYKQYYPSFVGVVFSEQEGGHKISSREISQRAPEPYKFVVRGNLDLGVISRAVFVLVRGTSDGLFDQFYGNDPSVLALSSPVQAVLNQILSRYASQLQLQLSA